MSKFHKATKSKAKCRLAICGPSGSGKTYSALAIAGGLVGPGGRIAVIDTEHGSASKYADGKPFDFDVIELGSFDPRNYIEMIHAAEDERYDALVIDSLTHAWTGKGGILELVNQATTRSKSSFTAWKEPTQIHNALIEAIVSCRCHVIATMRSKVDYILEADANTGKSVPRRVGMAPVQREGMDYEFDVQADMDHDHNFIVMKSRCTELSGAVIKNPGADLGKTLNRWLSDGMDVIPQVVSQAPAYTLDEATGAIITGLASKAGFSPEQLLSALAKRGASDVRHLSQVDADEIIAKLRARIEAKRAEDEAKQAAESLVESAAETLGSMLDAGHREMVAAGKAIIIPADQSPADAIEIAAATRPPTKSQQSA